MSLRTKIVVSIWGVVMGLLIITFFIINYWSRDRIEQSLTRELRAGVATIIVHEKLQSVQLVRACMVIAESPRLRAVAELGDAKTAFQLLRELHQTTLSQVFVLTDRRGRPLVQLLRGVKNGWDLRDPATIQNALRHSASTDVWSVGGAVFRVVSVPILVQAELVGTLTMGFEIQPNDMAALASASNSEVMLLHDGAAVYSTLDSVETHSLVPAISEIRNFGLPASRDTTGDARPLHSKSETYLGTTFLLSLPASKEASPIFYLILKPFSQEVRAAMSSVLGTFALVSVVFLLLTTMIGTVVARGITRPIDELVKGTTEIRRGNYDYAIRVQGRDEFRMFADRFMEMSAALKGKITELGQLNRDLRERNSTLDDAFNKLRAAQEELVRSERLAATGKMTAQLAHEINNPIHNIQSCLKTALDRIPGESKGRELLESAFGEAGRLSRLTGQMLQVYRSSLVEVEMKPTSILEILEEAVRLTSAELRERSIRVRTDLPDSLPLVRGSRDKLLQVFLNLIANARDAMPNGGELEVRASLAGGSVRATVSDTGIGIPKEDLHRIFDAFFTTKGKVSGVGLGLSVSYGIVNQHRGSIEVVSEPDRGTAFTVVLPVERGL